MILTKINILKHLINFCKKKVGGLHVDKLNQRTKGCDSPEIKTNEVQAP